MEIEQILNAYANGYFPMASEEDFEAVDWVLPKVRGLLPIADIHISKSLLKTLKKDMFAVTVNQSFEAVIAACAASAKGREATWINQSIKTWFLQLHEAGFAHSVEVWSDSQLVGGLYGLAIGGVFCGESMFSRQTDASKVALIYLASRLNKGGFKVLDAQFPNPHLDQFGAYKMDYTKYEELLSQAITIKADFYCGSAASTSAEESASLLTEFLQSRSQTS